MTRNAKNLQRKSRKHQVRVGLSYATYNVQSGSSGKWYTIREQTNGSFRCSCKFGLYRGRECSHTVAVRSFLEDLENRTLSVWATPEAAARQRRPADHVDRGLWTTSRKSPSTRRSETALPVQYSRGRSKLFK